MSIKTNIVAIMIIVSLLITFNTWIISTLTGR